MRKRIFGRRLKRDTNERKALFRSLMGSLILNGRIRTTEAKAKAIKGEIEKLVTKAKKNEGDVKRLILSRLLNEKATDKIIAEIAPKFSQRPGGYTRILRLNRRIKDGAKMVLLTWVEEVTVTPLGLVKRNVAAKKTVAQTLKSTKTQNKEDKTTKKSTKKRDKK